MTCIRHGCTIDELGGRRERTADRYLRPTAEMHRLYRAYGTVAVFADLYGNLWDLVQFASDRLPAR